MMRCRVFYKRGSRPYQSIRKSSRKWKGKLSFDWTYRRSLRRYAIAILRPLFFPLGLLLVLLLLLLDVDVEGRTSCNVCSKAIRLPNDADVRVDGGKECVGVGVGREKLLFRPSVPCSKHLLLLTANKAVSCQRWSHIYEAEFRLHFVFLDQGVKRCDIYHRKMERFVFISLRFNRSASPLYLSMTLLTGYILSGPFVSFHFHFLISLLRAT